MSDAKLVRFAAVLVVLAGYVFVFRAGETRIGEQVAANARTIERLRAGERVLASRAALEAERTRLRARLRLADSAVNRSAIVARFLRDAAALAGTHHTAIAAIAASGGASAAAAQLPGNSASSAPGEPFDAIALEMTVEGRYADVLATIRALSAARVLTSVDVASLARKNAAAPDAVLTAALHVVLERVVPLPAAELAGVRARPV